MNDITTGGSSTPNIPLPTSDPGSSKLSSHTLRESSPIGQTLIQEGLQQGSLATALASTSGVRLGSGTSFDTTTMKTALTGVQYDISNSGLPGTEDTGGSSGISDPNGGNDGSGAISWGTLMAEIAQLAEEQNQTEEAQNSAVDSGELSQMSTASSAKDEAITAAHDAYKAACWSGAMDIVGGALGGLAGGFGGEIASTATTSVFKGAGTIAGGYYNEQSQLEQAQAQFLNNLAGSEGQEIQSEVSSEQNTQNVFSSLEQAIQSLAQLESQTVQVTRPTA